MEQWWQQIETSLRQRHLFSPRQSILVAVSGGLDSMVLLHILTQLAPRHGWKLTVAHFNHQLRGSNSDADEKLVRRVCQKYEVPLVIGSADVRHWAKMEKVSIEMAARTRRHDFLADMARAQKISSVALAHHADDQMELFILRWLRGAGGGGLGGMKWSSPSPSDPKIRLVRPLLQQTKVEIQDYAHKYKVRFREDASNACLDIRRNKIRHQLVPLLKKNFQPALASTLLRSMEIISAEADLATQLAREWLEKKRRAKFQKLPLAVQRQVMVLQLRSLGIASEFHWVESLRQRPGQLVNVADEVFVFRNADGVLRQTRVQPVVFPSGEQKIDLAKKCKVVFGRRVLTWKVQAVSGAVFIPRPATEYFDADKVGNLLTLRHWQPGDRFQPLGLKTAAKLQDLFTNAKIPRAERHQKIVAVAANGHIFWVEGLRVGEQFKLDAASQRRLKWCWQAG